jgi:hypothetical protein
MAEELDETIKTNVQAPKQVSADGVNVQQHSLPDQIAADKYLQSKKASRTRGLGIHLIKLSPPGSSD